MKTNEATILIADDDVRGLLFLKSLLESEGYSVLTASDGASAIELAKGAETPDAILLDVMMPGMDGFEVCRRLRADPKLSSVPIIHLTALDDRESKLEGLEAGADDFLTKPFDSTELLIRLKTISKLNRFRALSEERARFEQMVFHAPDAIVLLDEAYGILLANREFARLALLSSPDKAVGECFLDWLVPKDGALVKKVVDKVGAGESVGAVEVGIAADTKENHTVVEVSVARLPWQGRRVTQLVLRDVTDRKRLESQVMRFQRIELLGELAGSVVHDMNNVLSAVSGNLSLLEMQLPLSEEARTRMATIQQSVTRGHGILRQLLGFTRGSDGSLVPTDLGEVVREVIALVTPMMKYDYEISCEVSPDLPVVNADANQLHQVLMNLCVNARDAMPEGGKLKVAVALETLEAGVADGIDPEAKAGTYAVLRVQDSGTGMPPEVRAKLFAPFFTTKPPGKGTGLGLATVLRLVRRHRGFIGVDTELGKGTCFACYLPLAANEGQNAP